MILLYMNQALYVENATLANTPLDYLNNLLSIFKPSS